MLSNKMNTRTRGLWRALIVAFCALSTTTHHEVHGQSVSVCEGELGEANWDCEALAPVPSQAFDGVDQFLPLPGSPDPANPAVYQQIAGEPAFDESGNRNNNAAVFILHEGTYFCMVAESQGEAALFDAPEGGFISSSDSWPTGSWLGESVKALLAEGTKLKYIVYSHSHWDHIGASGFVADYFADDMPRVISSRGTRKLLEPRFDEDPSSAFGNNRGIPLPEAYKKKYIKVGELRFEVDEISSHQAGDWIIFLDKTHRKNAHAGIDTSVAMAVDSIFNGWAPFYLAAVATNLGDYIKSLDTINGYDFDVLVAGHLTRLGTKDDVQALVDFYADILAGAIAGLSTVGLSDVVAGTGIGDPDNVNVGNTWLVFNEYLERVGDVCEAYVLDVEARGRDWLVDLAGTDLTLRSQCWIVQSWVRVG